MKLTEQAKADRGKIRVMGAALIVAQKALAGAHVSLCRAGEAGDLDEIDGALEKIHKALGGTEPFFVPSDADPQTGIEYGDLT